MTMRTLHTLFIYIALALSLAGCKNEDDIEAIFEGKTWYITSGYVQGQPLRGDNLKTLCQSPQTYNISFSKENFTATLGPGITCSGRWQADGKSNTFSFNVAQETQPQSQLDRLLWSALKKTVRYSGDTNLIELYADEANRITLSIRRSPESII
jgi:hypothetical protein